jgi:tetratricopeptide (TPR) repeat protein
MKYLLLSLTLLSTFIGWIMYKAGTKKVYSVESAVDMTMCGVVSPGEVLAGSDGKYVVALPGWGNYHYAITTGNDSAQFYFNQGLSMYYSYHMKEATASFREAARFDPGCAMAYWGEALTLGPYYNAAHTYEKPERLPELLALMNQHAHNTDSKEKRLIKAMNVRYDPEKGGSAIKASDAAYADELKLLIDAFPEDQDIKVLYVDAVMLMHAWDFWDQKGNPKSWTQEVVALCENVLKVNPEHPAALHYHIHLTEASHHPEVALANADALKKLLPGVAHMVHMASHEYQRNGLYGSGVEVNDLADSNLLKYDSLAKNLSLNTFSPHYYAVQTYCALSGGMYKIGMKSAERCRKSVAPTAGTTYDQYLYMMPTLTLVRIGKWNEILGQTELPNRDWSYATLLHHFAMGMAHINTGKPDSAVWHLSQLRNKMKDPVLLKRRVPFNSPAQIAPVAEKILQAAISFEAKKYDQTISVLNDAIVAEDQLIYTEPNDWPVPARQYLGAYLIKMKRFSEAESVYRQDLVLNPGNGWSNLGLYQSLLAQKKREDLESLKKAYTKAFSDADEIPKASVYL